MTKIKIFSGYDISTLTLNINEFIDDAVEYIQDIKYESFPVVKKYNSIGVPIDCTVLDRVLIMYEPKQEDQEDDDCEFCSFGEMLESLKSVFNAKKEKESEEYSDDNKKPSYNPVEKAYFLVKDLNERASSTDTINGRLEEILGYLGEALE